MSCTNIATETLCKKSSELRHYSMDFSKLMATAETISGTPTVEDETDDLTISSISTSGQTVLAWITDGTRGKTYTVVFTINTSGGQVLVGEGRLRII
jgi:hypothetical protein